MYLPKLKAPIVLVHGLMGYDRLAVAGRTVVEYFRGIRQPLEESGNRVLVPCLSATAGVGQRAKELKRFIEQNAPADPVHVIAHSMGGLDARHAITHLGLAERVLSLTTIGTPHRGTHFADWGLRCLEAVAKPIFQALNIPYQAFLDLTTAGCHRFNEQTPNVPNVRYFSVAGRCERAWLSPTWWLPHAIVSKAEGPNDGIVSIESARFGEHTDVWDGDHLNLINVLNVPMYLRGQWTDRTVLYGGLVRRLSDCGF